MVGRLRRPRRARSPVDPRSPRRLAFLEPIQSFFTGYGRLRACSLLTFLVSAIVVGHHGRAHRAVRVPAAAARAAARAADLGHRRLDLPAERRAAVDQQQAAAVLAPTDYFVPVEDAFTIVGRHRHRRCRSSSSSRRCCCSRSSTRSCRKTQDGQGHARDVAGPRRRRPHGRRHQPRHRDSRSSSARRSAPSPASVQRHVLRLGRSSTWASSPASSRSPPPSSAASATCAARCSAGSCSASSSRSPAGSCRTRLQGRHRVRRPRSSSSSSVRAACSAKSVVGEGVAPWPKHGRHDAGRRRARSPRRRSALYGVLGVAAIASAARASRRAQNCFLVRIFGLMGIWVLLALGLNIVVGYAGLLDLGYIAFYAMGGYSGVILGSVGIKAFGEGFGRGRTGRCSSPAALAGAVTGIALGIPGAAPARATTSRSSRSDSARSSASCHEQRPRAHQRRGGSAARAASSSRRPAGQQWLSGQRRS